MKESCQNCRFFQSCEDDHMPETGYCRRHAPVRVIDPDGESLTMFPETVTDEWCGDYQPAAAAPAGNGSARLADPARAHAPTATAPVVHVVARTDPREAAPRLKTLKLKTRMIQ